LGKYFHDHQRFSARARFGMDFKFLALSIRRALGRSEHVVKGRKRLYASSLAFKTTLALVPALAILMSIWSAEGFSESRHLLLDHVVDAIYPVETDGNEAGLDPQEKQNLRQLNEASKQQIIRSMARFAGHARKVGVLGLAAFAVVVFLLLRDVEEAFNFLWGVERGRPAHQRVLQYSTFFLGAAIMTLFLITLQGWLGSSEMGKRAGEHWVFSDLLPFVILWMVCAWIYQWMPNTEVDRKAALLSGLGVAFLLEGARWLISLYSTHMVVGSKVYGALWMIPVILIWFYLFWAVILFGAEVTFFLQGYRREAGR
jgi:membrane protein